MSHILLSFFLALTASAHSPPPIDMSNSSGQKSHSGYGYYGNDDYEGFVKLRKSCTEQDRNDGYEVFQATCVGAGKEFQTMDKAQYIDLAKNMVNGKFIDKILGNAIDEIKLLDPSYTPQAGCFEASVDPAKATLQDIRKEAMSLNNALSASILSIIHKDSKEKGSVYQER